MPNDDQGAVDSATQSEMSHDTGVKGRLVEVAGWGWRAVAVCIFSVVMFAVLSAFIDQRYEEDALLLLFAYVASAVGLTLVVWLSIYILHGRKAHFLKLLHRIAFGSVPFYFWFVFGVLYFTGLFTALSHDASDSMIRWSHFSEGIGTAFAALLLGSPFWFFAPKKWGHVGHMVGTVLMGILIILASNLANSYLP